MNSKSVINSAYQSFKIKDEEFLIVPKKDYIKNNNLEKKILQNFLKDICTKDLKKEGYTKDSIDDFVLSYLETFDKNNLVNI